MYVEVLWNEMCDFIWLKDKLVLVVGEKKFIICLSNSSIIL